MSNRDFQAAIFDLDGVVVNTVQIHFKAWKRMFEEYGYEFSFEDYKKKVDGIPRIDGAKAIMKDKPMGEVERAASKKQGYFREILEKESIPQFDTTINLVRKLKSKNIKVAVISSSKNCFYILDKINLTNTLDTIISGHDITKGKPDPQIFLMAAERIGVRPENCVVFEDALLGVEAAKRAGMICVGIDRYDDPGRLKRSDVIVKDLSEVNYNQLKGLFT